MGFILRCLQLILSIRYKYLWYQSLVIVEKGSTLTVGNGCKISKSKIVVKKKNKVVICDKCQIIKSTLAFYSANGHNESIIGKHTCFKKVNLQAYGSFQCGDWNIFVQKGDIPMLTTFNGCLIIGHHNRFMNRFWIRYNATIIIGSYNNINEGSWLRADENIIIGDYNQISYNVMIWDTNTHNLYELKKRRMLTEKYYPFFGYEYGKPNTSPVKIGSDCWVAQNAVLMKGTEVGNEVVIGYGTIILGTKIPCHSKIVNEVKLKNIAP